MDIRRQESIILNHRKITCTKSIKIAIKTLTQNKQMNVFTRRFMALSWEKNLFAEALQHKD